MKTVFFFAKTKSRKKQKNLLLKYLET